MSLAIASFHDTKAMRDFAKTMIWAFPLFFSIIIPWLFNAPWAIWPIGISAYLLTCYFIAPKGIYPLYRIWMGIALVLGWINTRILLAIAFYLLIFPLGLMLRLFKKLQYTQKPRDNSNWIVRDSPIKKERLEEPF